jgi:SAM-dependent methyltransferase
VFCVDTEGPCADPDNPELLGTWDLVDLAIDEIFDPAFRARYPDPTGGTLRVGWFFLTWTGFTTNPRDRAYGYHAVRDHYLARWGERFRQTGDEHCWHYHHPPASGVGNEWGLDWLLGNEHDAILSRQLLDRNWFPVCFRAGGTIMDPVSSRWVDRWFPFDYSNRAPVEVPGLVDWSGGVAEWGLYHPDPEDFTRPGSGRRRMARCLDLATTVYRLSEDDVEEAFARAADGEPAILACFDHDYREIADRVDAFRRLVSDAASRHAGVPWRYAGPIEAAWAALGSAGPRRLEIEAAVFEDDVHIWSTEPLFQSMPWLAVRTPAGEVCHVEGGLLRIDETRWVWQPQAPWTEAALGGSTDLGSAATTRVTPSDGPGVLFSQRSLSWHPLKPRSIWEYTKTYTRSAVERSSGREPELDSAAQTRTLIEGLLRSGESLLDVGCGSGHLYRSLRPMGVEYHGIDSYRRAIEVGRLTLADTGLPPDRLRVLAVEDLPIDECYDAVVCISTLMFFADFRGPLEAMARAARRLIVVRASFGEETEVRYLEDRLLEPGFDSLRSYYSIFAHTGVEAFLADEGFDVKWIEDNRQRDRFGGQPEVVGGVALPYEFMVAQRR